MLPTTSAVPPEPPPRRGAYRVLNPDGSPDDELFTHNDESLGVWVPRTASHLGMEDGVTDRGLLAAQRDRCAKFCEHVTVLGGVADVGLMVAKGAAGYFGGSTAMLADAAHSFGDLLGDAVSYVAIREARKPPDDAHPFGHGKLEPLGALGMAALLAFAALETARASLWALLAALAPGAGTPTPAVMAAVAAAVCIVVKELLYRITVRAGVAANSQATVANAYHHRSDAFTSVVALVGIGGAEFGWAFCDPLAGTVVAIFISHAAWEIGIEAFRDLVDAAVAPGSVAELEDAVAATLDLSHGAATCANMTCRRSGPFLHVSLQLQVSTSLTIGEVHDLQTALRESILAAVPDIQTLAIGLAPVEEPDGAAYSECMSPASDQSPRTGTLPPPPLSPLRLAAV